MKLMYYQGAEVVNLSKGNVEGGRGRFKSMH